MGEQYSVEEACTKCRHAWMREALESWLQQRGWSLPAASQQPLPPVDQPQSNGQINGLPVAS